MCVRGGGVERDCSLSSTLLLHPVGGLEFPLYLWMAYFYSFFFILGPTKFSVSDAMLSRGSCFCTCNCYNSEYFYYVYSAFFFFFFFFFFPQIISIICKYLNLSLIL